VGKRKGENRMGRAFLKGDEEKGKTLCLETDLVKDMKVFPIWLMDLYV
jgi:hypothetical protein